MPHCATMTQWRPIDNIVADLHQIVDLGALADHGVADRAAVDGGAGADLHVVLDDDPADLRDLAMAVGAHHVAEAVLADRGSRDGRYAVADQGMGDRRIRRRSRSRGRCAPSARSPRRRRSRCPPRSRRPARSPRRDRRSRRFPGARPDARTRPAATPLASNSDDGRSASGNSARATSTNARYGSRTQQHAHVRRRALRRSVRSSGRRRRRSCEQLCRDISACRGTRGRRDRRDRAARCR